jgi:hypothetical protein
MGDPYRAPRIFVFAVVLVVASALVLLGMVVVGRRLAGA